MTNHHLDIPEIKQYDRVTKLRIYVKSTQLQSNRFPINKIINNFRCLVSISIETRTLNYWTVSELRHSRKDKIPEFHGQDLDITSRWQNTKRFWDFVMLLVEQASAFNDCTFICLLTGINNRG